MGTHHTSSAPILNALALLELELPGIGSGLAPEQIRGAACVWCTAPLNAENATDFGARHGTFMGQSTIWYPRACRPCTNRAARTQYAAHPRTCEQCVDDPTLCDTQRALRRLALETRR